MRILNYTVYKDVLSGKLKGDCTYW